MTETPAVSPASIETPLAIDIAKAFHEAYERLAWERGYPTREESRKPWDEVPDQNKHLMVDTVKQLLAHGVICSPTTPAPAVVAGVLTVPVFTEVPVHDGYARPVPIGQIHIDLASGTPTNTSTVQAPAAAATGKAPAVTAHECAAEAGARLHYASQANEPVWADLALRAADQWRLLGQAIATVHGMSPPQREDQAGGY